MDPENIQLTKIPSKHEIQEQQTNRRSMQTNNIFNKLIAYNYNSKFAQNQELEDDITKFFDMFLWSQKNCPALIYQLFQMMAVQQVQQLHMTKCLSAFLKNYILILQNCKEGGLLAEMFLDHKLPHILLQTYVAAEKTQAQKQQMIQYLGSYLKSYNRIFRPEWLSKFVFQNQYFELLQVSFKFFNCPEPLTKTTVFNIVLALLGHKQVQDFVINNQKRAEFYYSMAEMMTNVIKNQLVQFGLRIEHISIKDSVNEIMSQIQDKIALWEDISVACSRMRDIFQVPFSKNVLLPLLIGPFKYEIKPIFTLKYSLFMIRKLLKTVQNFELLQVFIRMLFVEDNVFYWPNSLQKAKTKPFNLDDILNNWVEKTEQQQRSDFGGQIKKFYQGVFRSKDNHFILMSTTLLNHLFDHLKRNVHLAKKFGLQYKGTLYTDICQKLIQQLSQTHRLITIQAIINTLVIISEENTLEQSLQVQFVYIFKKLIQQLKGALKAKSQLWDFIVQVNQYDLLKINKIQFGKLEDTKRFEQMFKVVFMWDIKQQQSTFFAFYSSIPDTVQQNFRYLYSKFLMIRKAKSYLVEGPQQTNLIVDYYTKLITNSPFNPGDLHKIYQLKGEFHQCQILEGKVVIPAIWIVDENFFVLGHWDKQKKQIRIILGIKYKHISTELVTKKDKILLSILVRSYDYKSQRLKNKNSILVKGIQTLLHKIVSYQIKIREKQMIFISGSIKKTEESLPAPSLI